MKIPNFCIEKRWRIDTKFLLMNSLVKGGKQMIDRQIVVAKKEHCCFGCLEKINPGEKYEKRRYGERYHPICRKCSWMTEAV